METPPSDKSNPTGHERTTSHIHAQNANTYPPDYIPLKSPKSENGETPKGNSARLDIPDDVEGSDPALTQVNQADADEASASPSDKSNPTGHERTTSHGHAQNANTNPPDYIPLKSPKSENGETPKGNSAGLGIRGDVEGSDPALTQVNQTIADAASADIVSSLTDTTEIASLEGRTGDPTQRGFGESPEYEENETMELKDDPQSDLHALEDVEPDGLTEQLSGPSEIDLVATSMSDDMIASTALDGQFDESADNRIDESPEYEVNDAIDVSDVRQSAIHHLEDAELARVREGDAELTQTDRISLSDDMIASTRSDEQEEHIGTITELIEVTDMRESTRDSEGNSTNALETVDATYDVDEEISHLYFEKEVFEEVASPEDVTHVGILQLGAEKDILEVSESYLINGHSQYLIPIITGLIYFLFMMKRRRGVKSNCCCGSFFQQRKPSRISENGVPHRDYSGLVDGLRTVQEGLSSYRNDRSAVDHELGETSKQILESLTTQVPDDVIEPTGPPTARRRGRDIDLR